MIVAITPDATSLHVNPRGPPIVLAQLAKNLDLFSFSHFTPPAIATIAANSLALRSTADARRSSKVPLCLACPIPVSPILQALPADDTTLHGVLLHRYLYWDNPLPGPSPY